jgi:hypothetical protein
MELQRTPGVFLQRHAEHQTMWFDRNGWIVITPIALILIIGAAVLRPSDTPRKPHVSTAMVGHVLDWPEATGSSTR